MSSRSSHTSSNLALNSEQNQAIRNYSKRLDIASIFAVLYMLCGAVNYLLKQSHLNSCTLTPTISPCWPPCFFNCKKQFFKKQKPLAINRKNTNSVKVFMVYFEDELKLQKKNRKKQKLTLKRELKKR